MANPFVHVELMSTDLGKAKEFYQSLFDWKLEDVPGMASSWTAYVLVDDLAASTEKARALGATLCKGITEVPGMGFFSIMVDPTGATLAMWQPKMDK